jgi:uncharacterized membrane protein (UPF0182 family)
MRIGIGLIVAVAALVLTALGLASDFLVDWAWFSSLGYSAIFWTTIAARVSVFAIVFVATALIVWTNARIAMELAGARDWPDSLPWDAYVSQHPIAQLQRLLRRVPWRALVGAAALLVGLLVALGSEGTWKTVLIFLFQVPYGKPDPVFGRDIGFYLFSLPLLIAVRDWIVTVLILGGIAAALVYWTSGVSGARRRFGSRAMLVHVSVLLALLFAAQAWSFWLGRFLLLYSDNGVVVGAGYTDLHVRLPFLDALIGMSLAAALASLVNVRRRTLLIPAASIALVLGTSWIVSPLFAALFERAIVKPSELQREQPYIARNIALTREAYRLSNVVVKPFPAEETLSAQSLADNRPTIDNIRLWDRDPLLDTYAQLQEIRTYYKFNDADIDRYQLGSADQQVMISARELESSRLPANAQTWVNLHVLFTHGNGAVMSPVTRTTPEGLPLLYLKDIPPVASGGPEIREPRLYFGEGDAPYVIVRAGTPEFDYPRGGENVYRTYDGADGVPIGSLARRTLFAWYFDDPNILLSQYVTAQSRIMLRRNIRERAAAIAPFLALDHDPYIVVSEGKLFWIQDAYTTSAWFPYAQKIAGRSTNYIRNSVKIVIDAYNGTTEFYVSDPADPVIRTWQRIYRGLFRPISAMPADLRKHTRYPEDFFGVQAQIYSAYHMDSPEVFYNREDLWQFPRQPTEIGDESDTDTRMEPYYINIRLPGEARTEFVLMLPMAPAQRENMISWLAARCDQPDYGRLIVYEFPKEKLVYGPFQIEALINQNTDVSQQITLWNQSGSRVIRGNILVVPINNSILYVSPLYLRAQSGQMPELERVIAIYGNRVVMERTLPEALAALFKGQSSLATAPAPASPAVADAPLAGDHARDALAHYQRALAALKAGDWTGFGAELDALKGVLEQMNEHAPPQPGH